MCLTYVQYYIYKRRGIEMFSLMSACVLHVGVCVSPCVCLRVCLWVSGLITCLSHHHFIFVDVLFDLPLSLVCIFCCCVSSFVMFILACFFSSLPVTNFSCLLLDFALLLRGRPRSQTLLPSASEEHETRLIRVFLLFFFWPPHVLFVCVCFVFHL